MYYLNLYFTNQSCYSNSNSIIELLVNTMHEILYQIKRHDDIDRHVVQLNFAKQANLILFNFI